MATIMTIIPQHGGAVKPKIKEKYSKEGEASSNHLMMMTIGRL